MPARISEVDAAVQRVHNAASELHAALDALRLLQERIRAEHETALRGIADGEQALLVASTRAAAGRRARVLLAGEIEGPARRLSDGTPVRSSLDDPGA